MGKLTVILPERELPVRRPFALVLPLLLVLVLVACAAEDGPDVGPDPELFDPADRPTYVQDVADDSWLCLPWNYGKPYNRSRRYPLFVFLHGSGSSGVPSAMMPCFRDDRDADKTNYPSFAFVPHTAGSWDLNKLKGQIERLKSMYRIDATRIYLAGYSMGGSGSWALATSYYDSHGQHFAGIVRLAGESQTTTRDAIVQRTAHWYHVGAADTAPRLAAATNTWNFLANHAANAGATFSTNPVPLASYPGSTITLSRAGSAAARFTYYHAPVGHGISFLPFTDPALLGWLYAQRVQ